jgi:uncharacterized small protein (DUF1192 family)
MSEELIQLGYRELADRLGISPDAARMKAKRAAKTGRWRIIQGNHPSDRVLVEIPASELNAPERVGREQPERTITRTQGRTPDRTNTDAITEHMVAALQSAQARVHDLTDQLTGEKDRHRDTAVMLAQAEAREAALAAELERLEATLAGMQEKARRSWLDKLLGL